MSRLQRVLRMSAKHEAITGHRAGPPDLHWMHTGAGSPAARRSCWGTGRCAVSQSTRECPTGDCNGFKLTRGGDRVARFIPTSSPTWCIGSSSPSAGTSRRSASSSCVHPRQTLNRNSVADRGDPHPPRTGRPSNDRLLPRSPFESRQTPYPLEAIRRTDGLDNSLFTL